MKQDPTRSRKARAHTLEMRQARRVKYTPSTFKPAALRREMRTR